MSHPILFSTATPPIPNLISRSPLRRGFTVVLLVLAFFALPRAAPAVTPAPDGGYPNQNTAEGTDALFNLTTGSDNTANGNGALVNGAPTAPSNLTATAVSASQINLAWKDNSAGETDFRLQRHRDNGSFSLIATLSANTTAYADKELADDTTYYYRIRAHNSTGDSGWSNTASARTKKKPTPTPTPPPTSKKILHWQAGPSSGLVSNVVKNKTYIDTLPFDGIVVRFPDYQKCLSSTYSGTYSTLYNQLSPMHNLLTHVVHNYANVLIGNSGMVDPFDAWTAELQRWVNLAMACRDAGFEGIFFDDEEYNVHMWQYPNDCIYAGSKTVSQYQEQWRLRGNQVMAAVIAQWPQAKIVVTIDPYRSSHARGGAPSWLSGFFAMGMFAAAPGHMIDGGEHYQERTSGDYSGWLDFMKVTLTQPPNSPPLIPQALISTWKTQLNQSFGIYDQDRYGTPVMSYSVLQSTIVAAVPYATEFVWNYSESLDWLTPGAGSAGTWQNAVWNARSQLGLPPP